MDVFVLCAKCDGGKEHETGYELLAAAVRLAFDLNELPPIERVEGGKPWFPGYPGISFNISHSHGVVVCGVHDKPLGVDVEVLRPAPKRLASGMSDREFFCLWTKKEATVKREGRGIGALLHHCEPDPLCAAFENVLPGAVIAVCPSERTEIRFAVV